MQGITALARGGDVTPGHAYLVGEHHPEIFMAGASGHVYPSMGQVPGGSGGGAGDTHITIRT